MVKLSAIILSRTINNSIYEMTKKCYSTLIDSEKENRNLEIEIILVESNKDFEKEGYIYGNNLKIITPELPFNFHKFLNIGINQASGDFIALCNNDLIFHKNWFSEMLKVKYSNPKILSFSPFDETTNRLPKSLIKSNDYILGYELQKQMTGWCFVVQRTVFNKIGKLDELFNFYYADTDFAMCLIKHNIQHALICKSHVTHLMGRVTKDVIKTDINFVNSFNTLGRKIPKYVVKGEMYQVLNDEKMIDGVIKFHQKWGHRKSIKLKLLIIDYLKRYQLGFLSKYIL